MTWISIAAAMLLAGGFIGGLYVACRFEWPRRLYGLIAGAPR